MDSQDLPLVIVESPFKSANPKLLRRNVTYARACIHDCLNRGEAPFASHLFYTQPGILDDENDNERKQGIIAGLEWARRADRVAVYTDYGITKGMQLAIDLHRRRHIKVEFRCVAPEVKEKIDTGHYGQSSESQRAADF